MFKAKSRRADWWQPMAEPVPVPLYKRVESAVIVGAGFVVLLGLVLLAGL